MTIALDGHGGPWPRCMTACWVASDGHGGGDEGLTDAFLAAVASGDPGLLQSDAAESLMSHRVVWAAEQARLTGTVVTL
ncbi:hypothetical protein ACFLIM_44640 [Nonomuraea sp. M3C6]|uniref:Gfo/Idh/MocA-like oxidoreductase C-terminal domain-containing protein n=1 Tax=Nonomuraea marmarensis TaxID=3351344 RepID=A0ABW7AVM0_9ACTN